MAERAKEAGIDCLDELRMPIVLGVSGHRDLRKTDIARLEANVREFFIEFKRKHPCTPLIVLSPLAEGADRLVARVATSEGIGANLMVPLPMRQEFYEEDFHSEKSVEEFRELLRVRPHFLTPHAVAHQHTPQTGARRDAQYRAAGEFIVRHSQILIALWDGKPSQGAGGTADIVALQRKGAAQEKSPNIEPAEGFPVYWVPAAHARSERELEVREPSWLYPDAFDDNTQRAREYYERIFERVNEFNYCGARGSKALRKQAKESRRYVLSDDEVNGLSEEERLALERYALADALAIQFQKMTKGIFLALHILVFCAFLLFVLFAHVPKDLVEEGLRWWLLFASGVLLAIGTALLFANRRFRIYINYQDFRALAEGLRVALFWKLAGVSDSVADHYLWSQRSELDWIRSGIRGWMLPPPQHTHRPYEEHRLKLALERWVENQQDYFSRKEKGNERIAARNERIATALIICSALAGIALYLTAIHKLAWTEWVEVIAVEATLAAGALLHNYNERMAFERHAKQYGRMEPVFENAAEQTREALENGNFDKARDLLHELGKQALAENGDWVIIHRERPVEVPHP